MKTYCRGLVIDYTVVEQGFLAWCNSKAGKRKRESLIKRYGDTDSLITEIANEIQERNLSVRPIRYRTIVEPSSGKTRKIGSMDAKHQVLDYILWWCLRDMFEGRLGKWQCSSIKGRGQIYAARRIAKYRREPNSKYFVKTDVKKFYPSCSAYHVYKLMHPYIGSNDVNYLLLFLLESYNGRLNIGSWACQCIANLVMSFVYHFIENEGWKERRGKRIRLYSRQVHYMDDILIIGSSKTNLKNLVAKLKTFFRNNFGLYLKSWKICMCDQNTKRGEPIHMCGFRMWRDHMDVCKKNFIKARRSFTRMKNKPGIKLANRCVSYYGFLSNSDCDNFIKSHNIRPTLKVAKKMITQHDKREEL